MPLGNIRKAIRDLKVRRRRGGLTAQEEMMGMEVTAEVLRVRRDKLWSRSDGSEGESESFESQESL